MAGLRSDTERVGHLAARLDAADDAAAAQAEALDARLAAARGAVGEAHTQVLQRVEEHIAAHAEDVQTLHGLDARLQATNVRLDDLSKRGAEREAAAAAEIGALRSGLSRVANGAFGREAAELPLEAGRPLVAQVAAAAEAAAGKADAASVDALKASTAQARLAPRSCWHLSIFAPFYTVTTQRGGQSSPPRVSAC